MRVLVVDDNAELRQLLCEVLSGEGHDATAVNGDEAMVALDPVPDLILLDWIMEPLDGEAVLAALRGHGPVAGVPVVLMTALLAPEAIAAEVGLHHVLAKPFEIPDLLTVIQACRGLMTA